MDINKLKVLREIDYRIQSCCLDCKYGDFKPNTKWGVCLLHTYKHAKHTKEHRQLSIYKTGGCEHYIGNFIDTHWEEFLGK